MVYPKKAFFKNYTFLIGKNVYEPAEDTFLIADRMEISMDDIVLDMGTGCGFLAVIAAKKAKKVVAVDINPYAIKSGIKNAENNGVKEKIDFRLGDLFQTIKFNEKFSVILFNSPYLPSEPNEEKSWIGKAWAGGLDGRDVIDRFIQDSSFFLTRNGTIFLVQSSLSEINKTLKFFDELNMKADIISELKFSFEKIVLIKVKKV
jgi:release factor glutamine methyltransferase